MNLISKMRAALTKTNVGYECWEEYEMAPGLKCTVRFETNDGLPGVVDRFLRRKASIGELRQTLKMGGGED